MKKSLSLFLALFAIACQAETYGYRRDGTGSFPEATPPTVWATNQNVIWKTPMPGRGEGAPILVGDKIFVCSETDTLLCVSAGDGKILWQKAAHGYHDVLTPEQAAQAKIDEAMAPALTVQMQALKTEINAGLPAQIAAAQKEAQTLEAQLKAKPDDPALKQNLDEKNKQVASLTSLKEEKSKLFHKVREELDSGWTLPVLDSAEGLASTTPVSDGKQVYESCGTGVAVCYDLDGNRPWIRLVEKPGSHIGQRASPLLFDGKLFVHGHLKMFALDASSGKEVWQAPVKESFNAPAVLSHMGKDTVIVMGSGEVRLGTDGRLLIYGGGCDLCAPVSQDGVVYITNGNQGWAGGFRAFKLPAEPPATATQPDILWKSALYGAHYNCSPIVHDGLVYALRGTGQFTVMDAKTGAVVYDRLLDNPGIAKGAFFLSNLTVAGKYIYASYSRAASYSKPEYSLTIVIETGREYKEVARNELERFISSPVFRGKRMYLRTSKNLYCIGE